MLSWIDREGVIPPGNGPEKDLWEASTPGLTLRPCQKTEPKKNEKVYAARRPSVLRGSLHPFWAFFLLFWGYRADVHSQAAKQLDETPSLLYGNISTDL